MAKNDSYSQKLFGNTQRVRKDKTCALYIHVFINRERIDLPLNLYWPVDLVDNKSGIIRPSKKNDTDWQDYQFVSS